MTLWMSCLRCLRLLTLVVWVGGIIFFAFVVAPVAFRNLPNTHEAGIVVRGTLIVLNRIGIACGTLFLVASAAYALATRSRVTRNVAIQSIFVVVMLNLTLYTQVIVNAMEQDRIATGGAIDTAAPDDSHRVHFEHLHVLSERVEGTVLLFGLAVCLLAAVDPLITRTTARST